eukprot:TRINITY_DN2343_c1_g1_i1.p1 TRINITY_DN2343_c1_g1~~TRINITY_DN2343_c1_g1_i1.p1  ORF type:complete len:314 (+),score=59.43 TRINITY_DN2343_c1_g1_i1:73-942(+)
MAARVAHVREWAPQLERGRPDDLKRELRPYASREGMQPCGCTVQEARDRWVLMQLWIDGVAQHAEWRHTRLADLGQALWERVRAAWEPLGGGVVPMPAAAPVAAPVVAPRRDTRTDDWGERTGRRGAEQDWHGGHGSRDDDEWTWGKDRRWKGSGDEQRGDEERARPRGAHDSDDKRWRADRDRRTWSRSTGLRAVKPEPGVAEEHEVRMVRMVRVKDEFPTAEEEEEEAREEEWVEYTEEHEDHEGKDHWEEEGEAQGYEQQQQELLNQQLMNEIMGVEDFTMPPASM